MQYIDLDSNLESHLLVCKHMNERLTGRALATLMVQILTHFDLVRKVNFFTVDNASTAKAQPALSCKEHYILFDFFRECENTESVNDEMHKLKCSFL